jgi:sialate O-acetylesterase
MRQKRIIVLAVIAATEVLAELTLPSVFSDHMILQREQTVPVWGEADEGAIVTVEFAGQKKTATADADGKWKVGLDPMPASSDSREMKVSSSLKSANEYQQFADVLVGEVWLCSGQSNMKFLMKWTEDAETAIATATNPQIRFYLTPTKFSIKPENHINSRWQTCTSESVGALSGVAYYFGKKLQQDLDVPVGLLESAWGGSRIEPWTSPKGFRNIDSLADIYLQIQDIPANYGENPRKAKQERQFPTLIYNAMIHAHIPYAIRGTIWYQGEANHDEGMLYVDKTKALLKGWRELWGYDFPFYFVQIAPCQYNNEPSDILPVFWEAQAEIVKQIPNTGMAVISDVATINNLHPPNKRVPGERLALLAEAKIYGMDVVCAGPIYREMKKPCRDKLQIVFDPFGHLTTRDGEAPDWFEIAGEDGVFKPAEAKIQGDSVFLSSPEVSNPVSMRFAWDKVAVPNLMNDSGLPASSFRAGIIISQPEN